MTKKRGRPNGSKKDQQVVVNKFATVIKDLQPKQRKVLDQLLFSATDPSVGNPLPNQIVGRRQLPQNQIKKDHLLIKSIKIDKNMRTGDWEIVKIETNQGDFATGPEQTEKIDQKQVRDLIFHLKDIFEQDIKDFLEEENANKD